MSNDFCPCGSGDSYSDCCGRFIDGDRLPDTAEQLMRSRCSAYARRNLDYLLATWHPTKRPSDLNLEDPVTWLGLRIIAREEGGAGDTTGTVEFVARYKAGGRAHRVHERSRFQRLGGRWLYVGGEIPGG